MQFGLSAPKRNADGGYMCSVREGTERMFGRTAGKVLVLAQGEAFSRIAFASRTSRALTVLWEGDALALFSLPEVGCVLASGGQDVLCAARFFAAVRRVPCALFPTQATLDGVFERRAQVHILGKAQDVALAEGELFCDEELLRASLAEGYARLLLSRLALLEARMTGLICRRPFGGQAYERAFALLEPVRGELTAEQVVEYNLRMRLLEREGAPVGEGRALARLYCDAPQPSLWAQRALSALYYAFLGRGKPRAFLVPDYRARAASSGAAYEALHVPDAAEYAARALALERARGELYAEIVHLRSAHAAQLRAVRALGGGQAPAPDLSKLVLLPELVPDGMCAVLRDFGLLEHL